MQRHYLRALSVVVCLSLLILAAIVFWPAQSTVSAASGETAGSLAIIGKKGSVAGSCPLRHTEVRGAITGFLARVNVTQTFENTASQKIEAVYSFPLPENAAVDDMTIQVGTRTVRGIIKKREEARAIYEQAKQTGHVAALLDQERPNIFTQSVANILPGEQITVTISYLQTLEYENGAYQFVFPMVVAPRYIPGAPVGRNLEDGLLTQTRYPMHRRSLRRSHQKAHAPGTTFQSNSHWMRECRCCNSVLCRMKSTSIAAAPVRPQ